MDNCFDRLAILLSQKLTNNILYPGEMRVYLFFQIFSTLQEVLLLAECQEESA